ncbi:MAG: ABC transporter permease [Alphaproteobacteria bacterium]|nr:ABC transporter permease [Alphaproteobacteria bacterium]
MAFVLAVIAYGMTALLPGSSVDQSLGISATSETIAIAEEHRGLNRPHWQRFADWIRHPLAAQSEVWQLPVGAVILERLPASLTLGVMALLFSTGFGIVIGVYLVRYPASLAKRLATSLLIVLIATPNFWLGTLLIWLFAIALGWLPSGGLVRDVGSAASGIGIASVKHFLLPALALALPQMALFALLVRSGVESNLTHTSVRTMRALGGTRRRVRWQNALPLSIAPLASVVGMQVAIFVAGAVIIENVFALPGIGRLLLHATEERDHTLLRTLTWLISLAVVLVTIAISWGMRRVDWRSYHEDQMR